MSVPIVFITTFQIEEGALEKFKEAARRSTAFIEANGPQLMAAVAIDENEMRAHGIQIHRDSESILTHWQITDPYMRDVMQHIRTTRVDIYGQPNEAVMEGMRRLASQGAVITVTPYLSGFSRFPMHPSPQVLDSLNLAFSELDRTFSRGLVDELAELFAADARMLWPGVNDIVGREAIRSAFANFFEQFSTLSFSHDRQLIEVFGKKAFVLGKFIEDLSPRGGGPAQRIHGRMVELWVQNEGGEWEITLLLTSRYAENVQFSDDRTSA